VTGDNMFVDLLAAIGREIDGRRAWDNSCAVQAIDRSFTFSRFRKSAELSADLMRAAGLAEVQVQEAPADGRSVFGDWLMPLAWEVEEATLDIISGDGRRERAADRAVVPQCLAMWSGPTPPDGTEADIVWVADAADGSSYPRDAVAGKIVFTSAHPHAAKRLVCERDAAGMLSDYQPAAARLPDAVSWINAWSDDPGGWAFTARDTPAWCFMISPRQGEQLRARMQRGERLRGRAVVRSSLGEGTLPLVTGVIPGAGPEEVLLLGHQFEVGAVDNASGIGIMLEVARALRKLISEGRLPALRRTIRFLFVSECYTTLFWAERSGCPRRTVAGVCLDAPCGATDLAIEPLTIYANPHSQMSYVDSLMVRLACETMGATPTYPWRQAAFAMTDNLVADRTIDIPCPWVGAHSRTWHSSADTPQALDADAQGLVARMCAAYAYVNATADREMVLDLALLAAAHGREALARAAVEELGRAEAGELDDSLRQLEYLAERQAEAVGSVLRLLPPHERAQARPFVRALQRDVARAGRSEAAALARRTPGARTPATREAEDELGAIRPQRLVIGPVTLDRVPPDQREGKPSPRWSGVLFAVLNWCDGKRSLAQACELAARELRRGRTETADELARRIDPSAPSMLDYFEFLRRHGYVEW